MREYEIWRIVDVNMYNSLLSPEFALEEDVQDDAQEAAREALWDRFDLNKYKAFICDRAVIELKKLLKRLPKGMRVRYVEGSAEIYSPPYYNYGGDELIFRIKARSHRSQKSMQRYLENFFREEWNKEFGPDYAIYEYIRNNKGLEDFLLDVEPVRSLNYEQAKRLLMVLRDNGIESDECVTVAEAVCYVTDLDETILREVEDEQ